MEVRILGSCYEAFSEIWIGNRIPDRYAINQITLGYKGERRKLLLSFLPILRVEKHRVLRAMVSQVQSQSPCVDILDSRNPVLFQEFIKRYAPRHHWASVELADH